MTVRVFVVDDHELFRSGVRSELHGDLQIVGDAGDVADAVEGIRATAPDVVLLDVHMPNGGGRAVIDAVRAERPEVKFLALSVSDAAEDVIGVIRAGARGYVTKSISAEELDTAVRRVHEGDAVFSPRLAGSCSTPSPRRSRSRRIPSSTSSPHASERSCATSRAATRTRRSRTSSASR